MFGKYKELEKRIAILEGQTQKQQSTITLDGKKICRQLAGNSRLKASRPAL